MTQRAKSRGFCRESLGMVDPWWRGIPGEIWVVSETRIHGDFLEIPRRIHKDFRWIHRR